MSYTRVTFALREALVADLKEDEKYHELIEQMQAVKEIADCLAEFSPCFEEAVTYWFLDLMLRDVQELLMTSELIKGCSMVELPGEPGWGITCKDDFLNEAIKAIVVESPTKVMRVISAIDIAGWTTWLHLAVDLSVMSSHVITIEEFYIKRTGVADDSV